MVNAAMLAPVNASISTPVRAVRPAVVVTSIPSSRKSNSTVTKSRPSGWHSGINSAVFFKAKLRLRGSETQLKAGSHSLRAGMSVDEILNTITVIVVDVEDTEAEENRVITSPRAIHSEEQQTTRPRFEAGVAGTMVGGVPGDAGTGTDDAGAGDSEGERA